MSTLWLFIFHARWFRWRCAFRSWSRWPCFSFCWPKSFRPLRWQCPYSANICSSPWSSWRYRLSWPFVSSTFISGRLTGRLISRHRHVMLMLFLCQRSPATHHMSPWVKKVFTVIMPRLLLMSRPIYLCQGSCGDERKKKNQFYNGIDYSSR